MAVMAAMFVYASLRPGNLVVAVFATGMSVGFACLGVMLALMGSAALWGTPAPYVWAIVGSTGLAGVTAEIRNSHGT